MIARGRWRWAMIAALLAAGDARAQVVVGTVLEQGTAAPVAGAMVILRSSDGTDLSRFLTAADGRFRLRHSGGGLLLLVERIGYATTRVGPIELDADETREVVVRIPTEAVDLRGLAVRTERGRCSVDRTDAESLQALWGEARKALDAAMWTERESGLRFRVETRTLELDLGGSVEVDHRDTEERTGGNSVRTLPPELLAGEGYARTEGPEVVYYGPDAGVLLSDAFARTHCFALEPPPDSSPGLAGIAFEPLPGRDVPDIEGVMWLDARTARLERVTFRFTGLDFDVGRRRAEGEVRFQPLADGRWMVRDWSIRAPLRGVSRSVTTRGATIGRVMVTGIREQGSRVLEVDGPGVSWRADRPVGTVRGVVFDSVAGVPLVGAHIALGGGAHVTSSTAGGAFELRDVPPGSYRVTFEHAALDTLGIELPAASVTVDDGRTTEMGLAVPPLERLLPGLCAGTGGGAVVGIVRDVTGSPVPGVTVRVVDGLDPGAAVPSTTTGRLGSYGLCGLPAAKTLVVEASLGPIASGSHTIEAADTTVREDFELAPPSRGAEERPGPAAGGLVGVAVDAGTGAAVEGALVALLDVDGHEVGRMLTDASGRFVFLPDRPGRYRLRSEHLAYAPVTSAELRLGSTPSRVELRLAATAIPLDEVLVEVERRIPALESAGYYRRQRQGLGLFLDRDAIEALNPSTMTNVFERVPLLNLMPDGSGASLRRDFYFRRAAFLFGICLPLVYLDGQIVRRGGDRSPTIDEIVSVHSVEAMELYPSPASTPVQYTGPGSACGVVVLWTRRG